MGRHKEATAALTHVRVSHQTKQLIEALRRKHQFTTIDKVLRYYLPQIDDNKPVFLTARQAYDLTHTKPINRLVREASAGILKQSNNRNVNGRSSNQGRRQKYQRW